MDLDTIERIANMRQVWRNIFIQARAEVVHMQNMDTTQLPIELAAQISAAARWGATQVEYASANFWQLLGLPEPTE